ncbi:hypothetical protein EQ836_14900 [Ectopseudomonas mendocina]|uniref:Transposase n=1 Tax=Ectopseudomonas mendocina TaxID=300 RepID=A0ABD7RV15_ECTME|nr:hypothetical protein [Pseudomonas mendocina]TRO11581.1 hypothetical protein EQ829_18470 [Pseudomonas mendocina]TRO16573.1 hypothetical protein EQ836_14900 [Pseudomonas mendocina]
MPLSSNEIKVGAVAYFDQSILNSHKNIQQPTQQPDRPGPFVCVQVVDGKSMWSNVTTAFRKERLYLEKQWRIEGSQKWKKGDCYLSDGASTYVGLNEAFIEAAANETPFTTINRPQITAEGVNAILQEILARGGRTI